MSDNWLLKQIRDAQKRRKLIPKDRKPYACFTGGDNRIYVKYTSGILDNE